MHDIEILAIWFSFVITGMILTMLLPRLVPESRGKEVNQDACERIPAHQAADEWRGSMILIGKKA